MLLRPSPNSTPSSADRALGNYAPTVGNFFSNQNVVPMRRGLRRVLGRSGIVPVGPVESSLAYGVFVPAVGELIPGKGQ